MTEPVKIRAGDSVTWQASYSDYSAADGWTLSYKIIGQGGGLAPFDGVGSGSGFDVGVAATETVKLKAGVYRLVGRVSKDADKFTVYDKGLKVEENLFALKAGTDIRSGAQRGLEAIDAVLEKRASRDQENYSINGRSLSRTSIPDLITLKRFYQGEVAKEKIAAKVAKGGGLERVLLRFN